MVKHAGKIQRKNGPKKHVTCSDIRTASLALGFEDRLLFTEMTSWAFERFCTQHKCDN